MQVKRWIYMRIIDMTKQTTFPRALLSQPVSARLAYFQGKVVAHPLLKKTHQQLWTAIQQPTGATMIMVFGPTGVGKTTLRLRVQQQLQEAFQLENEQNSGYIPVVGLEVAVSDAGNFRWRDYYKRALLALDEHLIERKRNDHHLLQQHQDLQQIIKPHMVTTELRWALEQALRYRQPVAFIIDEAQHFKKIASGRRLLDQMDTLKSLANLTGTVHVLVGTYELLSFSHLNAQLDRRSLDIHFPRYRPDIEEDMIAFKRVLLTFQRHIPLEGEMDLVSRAEFFYERSVGCVGVLKDWLTRSLAVTLEEGQKTLTQTILEQQAVPTRKLLRMAREIREGEDALSSDGRMHTELQNLLGLPMNPAELKQPNTNHKKSVGQRNPVRDPVGNHEF